VSSDVKFAVVGAGAVGGYYAARLARAGFDVGLVARGAHLAAIRARGLWIWSPLGDLVVHPRASADPADIGPVHVVLYAVKTYDDDTALPLLLPLLGPDTLVVTLQNGVSSAARVGAVVGPERVLAGPTYIATALKAPGVIEQTGTHRRIVFGEVDPTRAATAAAAAGPSARVGALAELLRLADIQAEPVADARVPLWEKFIYLAPFAAVTGAARQPAGVVWSTPSLRATFEAAVAETAALARAEGVAVAPDVSQRVRSYMEALPAGTRSSLLIDLQAGKRIELDALAGDVVRRASALGVPTPVMATLAATLTPYRHGKDASRPSAARSASGPSQVDGSAR
jgi:2-dehydropantoate 2-reductase